MAVGAELRERLVGGLAAAPIAYAARMTLASRMNCAALTPSRSASRSSRRQRSSLNRTVVARIGMLTGY